MKTLYTDLQKQVNQALWKLTQSSMKSASSPPNLPVSTTMQIYWPTVYQWALAQKWVGSLVKNFQQYLPVQFSNIPQPYQGIVIFQVRKDSELQSVAIDYSDSSTVNLDCAQQVRLYFKMQYLCEGYQLAHVVPGGFVPADKNLYRHLPYLRHQRDRKTFTYDVYGRFGRHLGTAIRTQAVEILSQQHQFRYEGGLKKVRYLRSLQEISRSKVCLDLPGNGSFCFRLVDYFAVGACVISYPHRTRLPSPLVDRQHIVYCREDFSDLLDLCAYYLENEVAREQICQQSRHYFDHYLDRTQLSQYYLTTIHNVLFC
ncbi:glycosyltransferase [Thermocoleostomius sinensis]|uniref:Glycosyltransferase n=1 Tax=Thermocoleostomius sinensis A174 TaxID=2016057 RepID=A0A9E8ZPL7_9CYAN|nr:glycosyltransferase [Thermocoleostomius sinensis]WAL62606.1 glycosyltransferase [Thermocoleostomius sinensis A174]